MPGSDFSIPNNTPPVQQSSFVPDTSGLKGLTTIADVQAKFNQVTTDWEGKVSDKKAYAEMWQIRNENCSKVNESLEQDKSMLGTVTVRIPTGADGKEIPGWSLMTDKQKEDIWIKAINGTDGYKISSVTFDKTGGNLACDYMYRYEGMTSGGRNKDNNDTGKSANATMINNIMTRNSNKYSQASQEFQYQFQQLNSAITALKSLADDFFQATNRALQS